MKGIVLPTGILAAIVLAAACGDGGDEQLSAPVYFQSLGIVMTDAANDIAFLNDPDNRALWFTDLNATRSMQDRSVSSGQDTLTRLQRLSPPRELETLHGQMVTAFATLVSGNADLLEALVGLTTNEDLLTYQDQLPLPGVTEASQQFHEACQWLEDFALGQNLGVDLRCDDI